jgi:hypothetical protein
MVVMGRQIYDDVIALIVDGVKAEVRVSLIAERMQISL